MTFMDAIMPTHAAVARAAAAEATRPAAKAETYNPVRKYVVVADDLGKEHAVVFSTEITHSSMVPVAWGFRAVSAGFVLVYEPGLMVIPAVESESLRLGPRPEDRSILEEFFGGRN